MAATAATAKNAEERARDSAVAADRERKRRVAAFLLNEARAFGIRVGAAFDAYEMVVYVPRDVPRDVAQWFSRELSKRQPEIIEFILYEHGIWPGASS